MRITSANVKDGQQKSQQGMFDGAVDLLAGINFALGIFE